MTDEMKANSATGWCVLKIGESSTSFVDFYESEGASKDAAFDLAEQNDGTTFMVFQKFGTAQLEHVVGWKGSKA